MVFSVRPVARLFSRDKLLDSTVLNVMGAQVFRALVARLAYTMRHPVVPGEVANEVAELQREGIVVLRDFLPSGHFERIRAECAWLDRQPDQIACFRHGPTVMETVAIRNLSERVLPSIYDFYNDPRLNGIVTAAEQRPVNLLEAGEREHLTHGDAGGEADPQTELHSDIFFNTHKAWFYLDDVRMDDGPLAYVRRSHRLTLARLGYVYRDSWKREPGSDLSRRISPEERRRCRADETVVTCSANTLVVVNTCGYHRRLQGQSGRTRDALHVSVRDNPFAPHSLRSRMARYPRFYDVLRRAKKAWHTRVSETTR
jgi:Phytanoyl-CoA dioxygenase (PhyH)